ncbi:hypothetical protein [Nocardia crassostreae]|uniref:hypothetical protein n=1 Tax=Nocardia crassostreae TaxID=53428 RepID=UPI00083537BF|nr:hypothetical protein [Nocardia crassostreae]
MRKPITVELGDVAARFLERMAAESGLGESAWLDGHLRYEAKVLEIKDELQKVAVEMGSAGFAGDVATCPSCGAVQL